MSVQFSNSVQVKRVEVEGHSGLQTKSAARREPSVQQYLNIKVLALQSRFRADHDLNLRAIGGTFLEWRDVFKRS
jgi:hypothetical protein